MDDLRSDLLGDPAFSFLAPVFEPVRAAATLQAVLPSKLLAGRSVAIEGVRVLRHRPGRRCVVELALRLSRLGLPTEALTLIGKACAKGLDDRTYRVTRALWSSGFRAHGRTGFSVPEAVARVPEWRMWLERKVGGETAEARLLGERGALVARRIAQLAHALHGSGVRVRREHDNEEELTMLGGRLAGLASKRPELAGRLEALYSACEQVGRGFKAVRITGIHHDFCPRRIRVAPSGLCLVDLDAFCVGDPGVDVGNFAAHLQAARLRANGDAGGPCEVADTLVARYLELAGEGVAPSIAVHWTLSLARLVPVSAESPESAPYTEPLLELCEQRAREVHGAT